MPQGVCEENGTTYWTYERFRDCAIRHLEERGQESVYLSLLHSTKKDANNMITWARDLGYEAKYIDVLEVVEVAKRYRHIRV